MTFITKNRAGLLIALALAVSPTIAAEALPVGSGELKSIRVEPSAVELRGADSQQQLIVTGVYANGGLRDLTSVASYQAADPKLVEAAAGLVLPLADGKTDLVIESGGQTAQLPVTVAGFGEPAAINFANEITPILTKLGCNNGGCHGKADGQNGFKLSLLGFDAEADYEALVHDARGRRIELSAPADSLLLLKPTGQLGHGGGKPLAIDSPDYRLLVRWIESGAPFGSPDDPTVVGIEVQPAQRLLAPGAPQQLAVIARYSDGSARDVTRRAEFKSNDAELVDASRTGLVETLDRSGEGSIMVRYLGQVTVFRATIPVTVTVENAPDHSPRNFIDELAFAKHRQLGLVAAELASDGEFIRRASLDIIGTLPTVEEVQKFSADRDPDKRSKLVDALLERPEYAMVWTLRWADVLRVRGGSNDDTKAKIDGLNTRAIKFHEWISKSLADNLPYDQFVRQIITADGHTSGPDAKPPILWYLELKNAEGLAEDTAQAFLGMRIQCARCHHHPFERWSQDDYWGLAGFYARVQWRVGFDRGGKPVKDGKPVRVSESARPGQKVGFNPEGQLTSPQGKVYAAPVALDGEPLELESEQDPRTSLVDWMVDAKNPFYARALVNRYWSHFFGRGIVEPVDDMRATNPASNPELLDALAEDFVANKFDLKHLIRRMATSQLYQLSSQPNATNQRDEKHFSRFLPRRLPAEVLFDALESVTGTSSKFRVAGEKKKVELEIRAIQRPHQRVTNYFLSVFGINQRDSACECGRESTVTLAQRVVMLNNGDVRNKLAARAKQLAADERPPDAKVVEAYLAFFAREPSDDELKTVTGYLAERVGDKGDKEAAYYDVLWALANSKEFGFQH